jgi:hypothetical protein
MIINLVPSDEVMYIMSGEHSFKIGEQISSGGPGTCVFMPRGIPHAWKYLGKETGRAFIFTRRVRRAGHSRRQYDYKAPLRLRRRSTMTLSAPWTKSFWTVVAGKS